MLSSLDSSSRPWTSNSTAHAILLYIHSSSPIILVVFFLAAFTAHSIATASVDPRARDSKDQIGPGGKLLSPASPKRSSQKPTLDFSPARKLLFAWLSVGAIATFVANTVVVILHALIKRKDNWWCGQSVAVRSLNTIMRWAEANAMMRSTLLPPSSSTPYF